MDTNLIGTITELKCITFFLELGYTVSVPQNPCRYDFILDTGENLFKVQVKTGSLNKDKSGIKFVTSSSHFIKGQHVHTHYKNDRIDFFCTWYDNQCYLVPVQDCGVSEKTLRLTPTKNGQVKGISWAKDFLAKEVLESK